MPSEQSENLITYTTISDEQAAAEKLGEVVAIVLPKIIQREITKFYIQKEKPKKLCEK